MTGFSRGRSGQIQHEGHTKVTPAHKKSISLSPQGHAKSRPHEKERASPGGD
jgi:hypothetical protein